MVLACVQDIRVAIQEIQTQSGQAEFCPNETRKTNESGKQKRGLFKKTTQKNKSRASSRESVRRCQHQHLDRES